MVSDTTVGAWPPPPGVIPNFNNPDSIAYRLIIISVVFPAVTIPIGVLRLYTKRYILKVFHIDDYLIVVATLLALGFSVLNCYQTTNGVGAHIWDIPKYKFSRFLKIGGISGPILYNISLLFTKLSLLAFYLRFSPSSKFTSVAYTTMVITVIYSLLTAFAFVFLCQPIRKYWDFSAPGSCRDINAFGITMSTVNATTDLVLLLLPLPIIRALKRVPLQQKIVLGGLLMAGSFVCIVSIIRLQVIVAWTKRPDMDWTRSMVTTSSWAVIEVWCAIICANLPNLRGFVRRYFPRIGGQDDEPESPRISDVECDEAVPPDAQMDHSDSSDRSSRLSDRIVLKDLVRDRFKEQGQSASTVDSSVVSVPSSDKSF